MTRTHSLWKYIKIWQHKISNCKKIYLNISLDHPVLEIWTGLLPPFHSPHPILDYMFHPTLCFHVLLSSLPSLYVSSYSYVFMFYCHPILVYMFHPSPMFSCLSLSSFPCTYYSFSFHPWCFALYHPINCFSFSFSSHSRSIYIPDLPLFDFSLIVDKHLFYLKHIKNE